MGADEALLLNSAGQLAEASAANAFLVRDGRLFTPRLYDGALPGVMRARVLAPASRLGYRPPSEPVRPGQYLFALAFARRLAQ